MKHPVIVSDIDSDPLWDEWRALAADELALVERSGDLAGVAITHARDHAALVAAKEAAEAVNFTEEGVVEIAAEMDDDEIVVSVRDTGCGITPKALPQIFEAFWQVDSRLSRRHGGAGLGLAIAQKLAELMGGRITVESQPGHGSIFNFSVPASPAPRP